MPISMSDTWTRKHWCDLFIYLFIYYYYCFVMQSPFVYIVFHFISSFFLSSSSSSSAGNAETMIDLLNNLDALCQIAPLLDAEYTVSTPTSSLLFSSSSSSSSSSSFFLFIVLFFHISQTLLHFLFYLSLSLSLILLSPDRISHQMR